MPRVHPRTPNKSGARDKLLTAHLLPFEPLGSSGRTIHAKMSVAQHSVTSPLGIPTVSSLEETRPSPSASIPIQRNPRETNLAWIRRRGRGRTRNSGNGAERRYSGAWAEWTLGRGGIPSLHFKILSEIVSNLVV
jgi:hypothetical protein